MELNGQEVVGYVASALVVVSLTMTSVVRLRLISLAGSIVFVAYGVLIDSVPIMITNGAIAVINLWFLRTELGGHRDLGASVIDAGSPFLSDFLQFHLADIHRFQPQFAMPAADDVAVLLLRDGLPAGVLIGTRHDGELQVALDYVLGAYRDSRLGRWIVGPGSRVLRSLGVRRLVTTAGNDTHRAYLERIGYRPDGEHHALDL